VHSGIWSLDDSAAKLLTGLLFSLVLVNPLQAKDYNSELCPASFLENQPKPIPVKSGDNRVYISSDSARVDSESVTQFEGKVRAKQANRILEADSVRYDRRTEQLDATGNIIFTTDEIKVTGDAIHLNLNREQGTVENAEYFTGEVNGRGDAEKITIHSKTRVELDKASFTTCPPENEAWALRADEINLDRQSQQGSAEKVILELGSVPVFYLPYIRFPIGEERLSGFLYPAIKDSNRHGFEVTMPYYWNIAPDKDATITPHSMSKRGLMLETEFRYLNRNNKGNIYFEYLPDDKLYGDDREFVTWSHTGNREAGWSTLVSYNYVSDTAYLEDFSPTLQTSSITHLNRIGRLEYNHDKFYFSTLLQDHQNISGEEPYQRLPQINFNSLVSDRDNELNYDFTAEAVQFEHRDETFTTGQRLKLVPYISYPYLTDPGFVVPKLSLHHLQYALDNQSSPLADDSPGVTVPVFSMDTGLFLERETRIWGKNLLHTLEPRLFYLYAPYKSQDNLPVFDTALTTNSESLLFAENRFSGNDRIGDANQVTAALTTRFYDQDDGRELFNASVGQIFYFADRQVTLPGDPVETSNRSSYLTSLLFAPNPRVRLSNDFQWNPETQHSEFSNTRISYQADRGRVINYDYRFTRNTVRSQGLSFAWRVNPAWQFMGGHSYDMENERTLVTFLGLRYDSCCWAVRLVGHEKFNRVELNELIYDKEVYLELELKGLSSIGSRKDIDTVIENGILGYSR
jgi:LPS-assembly protein